jgi:glutathione peroxidase
MIKRSLGLLLILMLLGAGWSLGSDMQMQKSKEAKKMNDEKATMTDYRDIPFKTITGEETDLRKFDGKVLLLVNTASECGYTPQYEGLEKLYETYKDSGLVIIGFPANNFGGQEPGTDSQILKFCQSKYNVTFPMMSKVSVKGADKHPLFVYLTEKSNIPGEIKWNFSKFLLNRKGELIARFDSPVTPMSDTLVEAVKKLL